MRLLFGTLALVGVWVMTGCGGKASSTATVTGTVTLRDGKPLPGGRIDFRDTSGNMVSGQIKADGTYEAKDVPPGDYKISIENGYLKPTGTPPPPGLAPIPTDNAGTKYVPLDIKYSRPENSGLTTTVAGSVHTFNVQLK